MWFVEVVDGWKVTTSCARMKKSDGGESSLLKTKVGGNMTIDIWGGF